MAERDHDPNGWINICTRRMDDGAICGKRYWLAWVGSTGRGKRIELDDRQQPSAQPHKCRSTTK